MAAGAFGTIFPAASFTTPTPETTPNIGVLASPGQPFGGPAATAGALNDAAAFSRAWSSATWYLTLAYQDQQPSQEVIRAFQLLSSNALRRTELQAWYNNQIATHFRQHVDLSRWARPVERVTALRDLIGTVKVLNDALSFYLQRPASVSAQYLVDHAHYEFKRLVPQSISRDRLHATLASVFYQRMETTLANSENFDRCVHAGRCQCKLGLKLMPVKDLTALGISGPTAERAFAASVHRLLQGVAIERRCFQVDWNGRTSVIPRLQQWIREVVWPFVQKTMRDIAAGPTTAPAPLDLRILDRMVVQKLGDLRTANLFDYVNTWPSSQGALLDIQQFLALSEAINDKARVCDRFIEQVDRRLLHAGASTTEILSIYVNVIHAFRVLDAKGVMLEKVSGPIRNYLRGRDDTVAIIAASFLGDIDANGNVRYDNAEKICGDITNEVAHSLPGERREHRTLNFDDMNWVPDPLDAGPEFRAAKSEDVLAYVLGLFDQEEFIKEVTTVLAQHLLLAKDLEYMEETKLIELFKSRLDATKLQSAEVMLKDVCDSATLNRRLLTSQTQHNEPATPRQIQAAIPDSGTTLQELYSALGISGHHPQFHAALKLVATKRNDLYFAKRTRLPPDPAGPSQSSSTTTAEPDFDVQVLSSFFWPQMRANDFTIPASLAEREAKFETSFAKLSNQRKLHFRRALARVDVKLELEDRTIEETEVPAWRASVIDAFAGNDTLTAEQLVEDLQMDEELVSDALNFWIGRQVLYQQSAGVYTVLERLDMDIGDMQSQPAPEAISAVVSQDAVFRENAPMFEAFIKNMLQNGGAKEVGGMMGITGMLKMVLPTFTYGDDEVVVLLEGMEGRGEVVRNGEVWSAK